MAAVRPVHTKAALCQQMLDPLWRIGHAALLQNAEMDLHADRPQRGIAQLGAQPLQDLQFEPFYVDLDRIGWHDLALLNQPLASTDLNQKLTACVGSSVDHPTRRAQVVAPLHKGECAVFPSKADLTQLNIAQAIAGRTEPR